MKRNGMNNRVRYYRLHIILLNIGDKLTENFIAFPVNNELKKSSANLIEIFC